MHQNLGEIIRQNWAEYVLPIIIGLIIIRLLIQKSTRKTTIKIILIILLGIAIIALTLTVIGIAEFYLFGADMFLVIYPFTVLELPLLFSMIMAFKDLSKTILLHKYGCRTMGTVIEITRGKGTHYKIQYNVNNKEYICIGNKLSQADKWKCGSDVTVLYLDNAPQKSCLAKADLISSIIMTVTIVLLMIGTIVAEYVVMTAL